MNHSVSIYNPVEIEIEGQKYKLKKLNRTAYRQVGELEKRLRATEDEFERVDIVFEQAGLMIDAPPEVLNDMDVNQLTELVTLIGKIRNGGTEADAPPEAVEEKNSPSPGGEPAA